MKAKRAQPWVLLQRVRRVYAPSNRATQRDAEPPIRSAGDHSDSPPHCAEAVDVPSSTRVAWARWLDLEVSWLDGETVGSGRGGNDVDGYRRGWLDGETAYHSDYG